MPYGGLVTSRPIRVPATDLPIPGSASQPNPGASRRQAVRDPRRLARARRMRQRQQKLVLTLIAATWLPGVLGTAFHLSFLRSLGVVSGYAGLSWALPGLVVGFMVDKSTRAQGIRAHRPLGVATAVVAAGLLLFGAATTIGS
jgi:hypothetical protein